MLPPLLVVTNLVAGVWIYACWRTIRMRWKPPADDLMRWVQATDRPLIFYSWHAYSATALYSFLDPSVPRALMPVLIGHDGFKSQVVQRCMAWFGWHVWFYRRKSPVPRREQIIQLVRSRGCHIAMLADSGGPYRRVKPGLVEVARATGSTLVPFVVSGRGILKLERPKPYRVPFPFCSLVFHTGELLDGRSAGVDQCQDALDELEWRTAARTG